MNNNTFLYSWITIFLLLGFCLPFIADELSTDFSSFESEKYIQNIQNQDIDIDSYSTVTVFDIIISIATIFVWNISGIPIWLNIILFVPRIIFYVVVYDKIRGI